MIIRGDKTMLRVGRTLSNEPSHCEPSAAIQRQTAPHRPTLPRSRLQVGHRSRYLGHGLAIGLLGLSAGPLSADGTPNLLVDSFQLSLGTFILDFDPTVRLDGEVGTGTPVDWKRTFGTGDVTRFRVDGAWRFGDRHKLRAAWFNYSRSRSAVIDEEISWGDEVFPVDAEVRSKFDFDVYQLGYEYAFKRGETHELTGSIGLHVTDLSASLAARGSVGDEVSGDLRSESGSATAPLPVIGFGGLWALPRDLWLNATAQYFYLATGDYKGRIQDYRVALIWQPRTWLGLGIGYDYFSLNVDVDRPRFTGKLDWTYEGPMLFYSASF